MNSQFNAWALHQIYILNQCSNWLFLLNNSSYSHNWERFKLSVKFQYITTFQSMQKRPHPPEVSQAHHSQHHQNWIFHASAHDHCNHFLPKGASHPQSQDQPSHNSPDLLHHQHCLGFSSQSHYEKKRSEGFLDPDLGQKRGQ